ncbi:GerW family sporulation protein [Pontibacillus sp. HMF3514]|uniref:GerW family sporulation protein n=1 Tax=Pontibacillus sp. HMF3514 TaxID=2692425 RepID=UPI00131F981B|nr:GerW family sporulation protein [Pontibacillus sp. HMF3514]QHE53262.1 sporulation protein YtfJ [Pontibacillus sp. HMF3514]
MSEHPIQGLMTTALESLKDMIDVNTIIGDPIETPDGSTLILTVSKVGFGFAAGGSQFKMGKSSDRHQSDKGQNDGDGSQGQGQSELPFGGGSGGGVSITPIAFLIVNKTSGVKMIHLDENTHLYERMLDLAPQTVQKIQEVLSKGSKKDGSSSRGDQQQQSEQRNGKQNNQNFSW